MERFPIFILPVTKVEYQLHRHLVDQDGTVLICGRCARSIADSKIPPSSLASGLDPFGALHRLNLPQLTPNLLDAFLAFFEDMVEIVENLLRISPIEDVR